MDLPQLNLGSMEFEDIKLSIKNHLKNQDEFSDFEFEGSAMSTLVDLLAYNTLYYAFYSNMIGNEIFFDSAQKVSSLISLAKPLGYVVPGARGSGAKLTVRVAGSFRTLPKYHPFVGVNANGASLTFYNFDSVTTSANGEADFFVYQGSLLTEDAIIKMDSNNYKGFIGTPNIDIRSLTIKVKTPSDADFKEWSLSDNINQQIDSNSEVYFIERFDDGFYVLFGGNVPNDTDYPQPGKSLPAGSVVTASYVTPSGEVADNYTSFSSDFTDTPLNNTSIVQTLKFSGGGSLTPNLESIKFFAPKWFASQGRVVTKQDAIAALGETVIGESLTNSDFRMNVWGGEEIDPPYYGRLFVSIINDNPSDENIEANITEQQLAVQELSRRTVVTIKPEYITPILSDVFINIPFQRNASESSSSREEALSKINQFISENYGRKQFNSSFSLVDFSTEVGEIEPGLSIDLTAATNYVQFRVPSGPSKKSFNLKNEIKQISSANLSNRAVTLVAPTTTTLEDSSNNVYPEIYIADDPSTGKLVAYVLSDGLENIVENDVGTVNYRTGKVEIYDGILTGSTNIKIIPNSLNFTGKHEMVSNVNLSVTIMDQN